jgi:hypothetical protein
VNATRRALYERLAGDATLTGLLSVPDAIYHQVAPQSAAAPFVLFHKQAGTPGWQFAGAHIQSELWLVKGVDVGPSAGRAEDIAARLDELLTDAPLTVAGRLLLAVFRDSDIDYSEQHGADTWRHCGALFRVATQP